MVAIQVGDLFASLSDDGAIERLPEEKIEGER